MAKRKRLSPTPAAPAPDPAPEGAGAASGMGVLGTPRRGAPIADVAGEAALASAADEMAEALHRAREEGRMILSLPLDAVETDYLVRDRMAADGDEMEALVNSLRARGQRTPIEVARLADGRYGLISGWRRVSALRRLRDETGEPRFAEVQALLRRPDQAADAYLGMIEENEIRAGLSYYERARIVARAVEQGVFADESAALRTLYANASRARRSKIGSFLALVRQLDGHLRFPQEIGERLGLRLATALEADPDLARRLGAALDRDVPRSAEEEQTRIAGTLSAAPPAKPSRGWSTEITPGATLVTHPDGSLTLKGDRVDEGLRIRLERWLVQDLTRG